MLKTFGRWWTQALLAALVALPALAAAQDKPSVSPYWAPVNPPDPALQLREMLELYGEVCLRAFPDDAATARRASELGGQAMTPERVRALLHEDPGHGWTIQGRTARFELTVEHPPYHACSVRTMTAAGFPDMGPYQAAARAYQEAHGRFRPVGPLERTIEELHVVIAGQQADRGNGSTESLLAIVTTPDEEHRAHGETAVEVRFTHQTYTPNS